MKLLDLYYMVKPAIPRHVRLRLRGYVAARQRELNASVWPINEGAAKRPDWWFGWPEGKNFAFVLTHDVEGRKGLDRCKALATLEMDMGFRSSFNFVPEGEYDTSDSVRTFLTQHGFEVGVHDLHHDGTLYRSRSTFSAGASRINGYLDRWQAVGFRSAFMRHNLEWLEELNILYDASTFDTDPFEPQPDGANTIFPFWVGRSNGGGYVELPYTLAQDSTLFLVLKERTNNIWKQKLDWVARHGGLALVNVHPDYIAFGDRVGRAEFPVSLYKDFLKHVSATFGESAWHVLPRDVAQYVRNSLSANGSAMEATNAVPKERL